MIKRLVLAVLALGLFTGTTYAADSSIGVVDVRQVILSTPQRETIMVTLQNEFKDRGTDLKALEDEIVALRNKLQNDAMTMSETEKTDATRSLESLAAEFQLKEKALQEDYQRRGKEENDKLMVLAKKAIDQVAIRDNLSLVLQRETAAFVDQKMDITNKVIALMSEPNFK